MSRLAQLPPVMTPIVQPDGKMRQEWYKYFRTLHSWSGLMGNKFEMWELDAPGIGGWDNATATLIALDGTSHLVTCKFDPVGSMWLNRTSCLPNSYTKNTDIYPIVCWMPDGSAIGNAVFNFEYGIVGSGEVYPMRTATLRTVAPSPALAKKATVTIFPAIIGDSLSSGDAIAQTILRDGDDADDSLTDAAIFLWAGFAYQRSGHGAQEKSP